MLHLHEAETEADNLPCFYFPPFLQYIVTFFYISGISISI